MEQEIIKLLIGTIIPSVLAYLIGIYKRNIEQQKRYENEIDAIKIALQAMLRDRMVQLYSYYCENGNGVPIYQKQNFENCYNQYHTLYKNGVMQDIYDKFMGLPIKSDGQNT